ncbi:MAG: tyrosine-protein phosphatase [Rhodobacteraceae bacterium]|nr:tyrosine-protein phosphatase [Paracoccaceae bacterium]
MVRALARSAATLAGAALLALLCHLVAIHATGNFAVVVPGEVYRSAQVTPDSIARYRRAFGIASILNLRGAHPGADWYDAELRAAADEGIVHADFALSASRRVGQSEAAELVELMEGLPKPLLIHCRHGSDRTGLAAALYLARVAGADEDTAEGALSIRYGHVAVPLLSAAWPMDQSFEALEPWLGFEGS